MNERQEMLPKVNFTRVSENVAALLGFNFHTNRWDDLEPKVPAVRRETNLENKVFVQWLMSASVSN